MNLTVHNFPRIIKEIRKINGWSVNEIAKHIGTSPRTIEGWEQGRPPVKYLIPLVNELMARKMFEKERKVE